jgi:regulator of protease activity HflC (stomatin/prohibitin superfamily)
MNIVDVIRALAGLALVVAIGMGVMAFARTGRNQTAKGLGSTAVIMLVIAGILMTLGSGLVYVESSERGVVKTIRAGGLRPEALGPGLHWILPVVEQVVTYSISNQTYTMSSVALEGQVQGDDSIRARTKDGQEVIIDASVIYQIDPAKVVPLHIVPEARGLIRDAVSQYGVEEVVSSKRAEMVQIISESLAESLAENNLILLDFVLRDIHFSEEYAAAVEQKQIAEQQAQQAKFVVEQKKQEAEQARQVAEGQADAAVIAAKGAAEARLLQADAEAQANQLLGQSLTPELVQYQYILKLSPGVQTIFIPSGNQFILPLPNEATTTEVTTPPVTP